VRLLDYNEHEKIIHFTINIEIQKDPAIPAAQASTESSYSFL